MKSSKSCSHGRPDEGQSRDRRADLMEQESRRGAGVDPAIGEEKGRRRGKKPSFLINFLY